MEKNKIYLGNNLDVLKTFPDNYFDSVVTDPPYGLGEEPNVYEVMKDWIEKGYHEIKGKGFMGKEWDAFVPQPILWKEVFRVLKPGGIVLSFGGTRTYDWMVMGLRFAGFEIRDMVAWLYGSGFPKSHNIALSIDKMLGHNDRGHRIAVANRNHPDGTLEPNGEILEPYQAKENISKQWEGWGTALKPAIEPIVMARKPFKGKVAENVLKYGTGGINIDECRIETTQKDEYDLKSRGISKAKGIKNDNTFLDEIHNKDMKHGVIEIGRFPANVIHDGSDEVVKLFPNVNGGTGETKIYNDFNNNIRFNASNKVNRTSFADSGSAARFFYVPKASKAEKNMGLYGFEEKYTASAEFRPNHMEKAINGENGNPYGRWQPKRNIHPTVKPIDLMRYLIRLVTPKGGIVLDPYIGSGTTAIAAKKEKMDYVGIELEEEYLNIAKARIKATIVEYDIFDYL